MGRFLFITTVFLSLAPIAFGAGNVTCESEADFPTYELASQHQVVLGHYIPPIQGLALSPFDESAIVAYSLAGLNGSFLSFNNPKVSEKFLGNDFVAFGFFKSSEYWLRVKSDGKLTLLGLGRERQSFLLDENGINFAIFSRNGEKLAYTTPENPKVINFVDLSACSTDNFSRCLGLLERRSKNVTNFVRGELQFSESGKLVEYRTYGSDNRPYGDTLNIVAFNSPEEKLVTVEINHFDRISSSVMSSNEKFLAVAERIMLPGHNKSQQVIDIYDIQSGNRIQQAFVTADFVFGMAFHCSNRSILLHTENTKTPWNNELITIPTDGQQFPVEKVLGVIEMPTSQVYRIGLSSDTNRLFLATEDGRTLFYRAVR